MMRDNGEATPKNLVTIKLLVMIAMADGVWDDREVALLETLADKFGEDNICLLTSPILTPGCIDGKMTWIRKHLPQYSRRFLIGPAKQFCAAPRHCLVDDSITNIKAFKEADGHTFLFPAPWNSRFKEQPVQALKEWIAALES